jgi:hypothetical protein
VEPNNQNQYDFILNAEKQKKSVAPVVQSTKNRLIIFILLLLGVITLITIGFSFINSIGKANNNNLISVKAHQVELMRVLEEGLPNVGDPAIRNRLATLKTTVASDQAQINTLLGERGVKLSEEQLNSEADTEATDALEVARKNGSYDSALFDLIKKISNEYYGALNTATDTAFDDEESAILITSMNNLKVFANQK